MKHPLSAILTREFLQQKYCIRKLSVPDIAKLVGCGNTVVYKYLRRYSIEIRSISEAKKGIHLGEKNPFYGKKHTPEALAKISKTHKGKTFSHTKQHKAWLRKRFAGPKNPNWKGGTTNLISTIRGCEEYSRWRQTCFERDLFACVLCQDKKGGNLHADHVIPISYIVSTNKISSLEEARRCKQLWDPDNGRTLCETCHKQTDTWGSKAAKFSLREV